jgi:phage tail sheath protein FI
MPFQLSPGVAVTEKDFTSIVPAVATSIGATVGSFPWGPVQDPVRISSENELVRRFGIPTDDNASSFFTAANFLAYANNLLVVRADTQNHRNAVATQTGSVTNIEIIDGGSGYTTAPTVIFSAPTTTGGVRATGTAVLGSGATAGEVVGITIVEPGSGYTGSPTITFQSGSADANASVTVGGIKINNQEQYTNNYQEGNGLVGEWAAKFPGELGNGITVSMADAAVFPNWEYRANFDSAPGTSSYVDSVEGFNDELHIIIIDNNGYWTGQRGSILEKFAYVSKARDAKKPDGTNNYYRDVINSRSEYVWWMDHPVLDIAGTTNASNWGSAAKDVNFDQFEVQPVTSGGITTYQFGDGQQKTLLGGLDDLTPTDGQLNNGWSIFADAEKYDISLLALGKASTTVATYVINNIAETRLDCVVFVSPQNVTTGDVILGSGGAATDQIIAYRDVLPSTSYAVMDSGAKYQYDRYNDKYRYIPLNGDIAGLCARTDFTNDPWFSPGGMNRGQIKNVVKLAVSANKTDRDELYKAGVNPVVTFPGEGTVLFGDKTMLAKPSAFDRINVRRLFIVLEKAIATASKFQLFEFNDGFTRAQFKNLVEPFLRDVQGRRGITDFVVKCDDTNNTGEVIDRNEFVADIFIKPARSINFISLNFVAARTGVNFSEIGA